MHSAKDFLRSVDKTAAADPQLTERVVPPGPHRSVPRQSEAMSAARRNGGGSRAPLKRNFGLLKERPSELPPGVVSPDPDRAVAFQGDAVRSAGADGDYPGERGDLQRHLAQGRGCRLSQLQERVVTPSPDGSVILECQ